MYVVPLNKSTLKKIGGNNWKNWNLERVLEDIRVLMLYLLGVIVISWLYKKIYFLDMHNKIFKIFKNGLSLRLETAGPCLPS